MACHGHVHMGDFSWMNFDNNVFFFFVIGLAFYTGRGK